MSGRRLPSIVHNIGWIVLFAICLLISFLDGSFENLFYWPLAYFFTLWASSFLIPSIQESLKSFSIGIRLASNVTLSICFGTIHFVTSTCLILLLERLFNLNEHFQAGELGSYWIDNYLRISEGVGWYWLYLTISALFQYKYNYERLKLILDERSQALANSNLERLVLELNPHFLFNAMNSIAMLIRQSKNSLAITMISNLNDLLREVLSRDFHQKWSLKREMEVLNKYLYLEEVRYGDRVTISTNVPEHLEGVLIPRLLLQPVVENAFKHGIANTIGKGSIRITVSKDGDKVLAEVFNSGSTGMGQWSPAQSGIGLTNVVSRLQQIYNTKFEFRSETVEDGLKIIIGIPYEKD